MRIELVYFDDWCALYFDTVLVYEGHSLDASTLMGILLEKKIFLEEVEYVSTVASDWLNEETVTRGSAPPIFSGEKK
jgi:hypothetical protein